jgi:hypothetical protein
MGGFDFCFDFTFEKKFKCLAGKIIVTLTIKVVVGEITNFFFKNVCNEIERRLYVFSLFYHFSER